MRDGPAPDPVSRIEQMRIDGVEPAFPHNPAPWLVDALMEAGPVEAAGMGTAPVSWREIASWQALTGRTLRPWEARIIRRLSVEFSGESARATKPECPAPWSITPSADERADIAKRLAKLFDGLA